MLIEITNWPEIQQAVHRARYIHPTYGDVVVFTNANAWYIPTLIKNLYTSMKIHEPNHNLLILCSDQEGYEQCQKIGYEHYARVDIPALGVSEYKDLNDGDTYIKYTKLCYVKTVLMRYILQSGYTPLYIDPDMALKQPAVEDLLSGLDKADLVIVGNPNHINTNIMSALPSSKKCVELYRLTTEHVDERIRARMNCGDEPYTCTRIHELGIPIFCVDSRIHPGGNTAEHEPLAKTVHANCVTGLNNKIALLKRCNAWYIN